MVEPIYDKINDYASVTIRFPPGSIEVSRAGDRAVRSLQLVSLSKSPTAGAGAVTALPPPFATNASSQAGRTLVMAIDEDSLRAGREAPLRQATTAFIAGLGPADRIALITLPLLMTAVGMTVGMSAGATFDFPWENWANPVVIGDDH